MKVLLLIHHSFLAEPHAKEWLERFHKSLQELKVAATVFRVEEHKLHDFDIFHSFGFGNHELLFNLKSFGKKTVSTPSLAPLKERGFVSHALESLFYLLRSISQRRLVPLDQFYFLRSLDLYLLCDPGYDKWCKSWRISQKHAHPLEPQPEQAAASARKSYQMLWARA